jgi:hypothetical protein
LGNGQFQELFTKSLPNYSTEEFSDAKPKIVLPREERSVIEGEIVDTYKVTGDDSNLGYLKTELSKPKITRPIDTIKETAQ